jgi:hypothetical protein
MEACNDQQSWTVPKAGLNNAGLDDILRTGRSTIFVSLRSWTGINGKGFSFPTVDPETPCLC